MRLAKREREGPHAGIEELDPERPVLNATFLPDELIKTRLSDLPTAVTGAISSSIAAGRRSF